jgi:hypothetical protein
MRVTDMFRKAGRLVVFEIAGEGYRDNAWGYNRPPGFGLCHHSGHQVGGGAGEFHLHGRADAQRGDEHKRVEADRAVLGA